MVDELFGLRDLPSSEQAEGAANDRFDVGLGRALRPDLHGEIVRIPSASSATRSAAQGSPPGESQPVEEALGF